MSATQPSLFTGAIVQPLYEAHESLNQQFEKWSAANPHVLDAFIALAQQLDYSRTTRRRIGAKLIIERLRWEYHVKGKGDDFALNNNFTSRLAREAVRRVPSLEGLFEFRELRS